MSKSMKTLMLGAAVAGLMAGTTATLSASVVKSTGNKIVKAFDGDTDKHACKGQNSCKGKGGCKAGDNGCKGQNSCKGKGGCATDGSKKN
jgi:hypothetical protein